MHFLSTGRHDRIQRWIAEQLSLPQARTGQVHDKLEGRLRKEHDALVDMEWELEELERHMALSASAFGRDWRASRISIDSAGTSELLKHLSNLTVHPDELQAKVSFTEEPELALQVDREKSEVPHIILSQSVPSSEVHAEKARDSRRQGRIISQPPLLPPEGDTLREIPLSNLSRSRTVPPPITTHISISSTAERAPITFILQEASSPLPSAMHFTPTPLDLEAFPTTPRSFCSVPGASEPRMSQDQPAVTPSEQQAQPHAPSSQFLLPLPSQHLLSPPLVTPCSEISTPSLSAFPSTPGSTCPPHSKDTPFPPPLPTLPQKELLAPSSPLPPSPATPYSITGYWDASPSVSAFPPSPSLWPPPRMDSLAPNVVRAHKVPLAPQPEEDDDAASKPSQSASAHPSSTHPSRFSESSSIRQSIRPPTTSSAPAVKFAVAPVPPLSRNNSIRGLMTKLTRSQSHSSAQPRNTFRAHRHTPSASALAGERGGQGLFTPPKTPTTPTQSVGAFLGGVVRSASAVGKPRLVVHGVRPDGEQNIRHWCENVGPVKSVWRSPGSEDVNVVFRDNDAFKKLGGIKERQINIPGVGSVMLSLGNRGAVER